MKDLDVDTNSSRCCVYCVVELGETEPGRICRSCHREMDDIGLDGAEQRRVHGY